MLESGKNALVENWAKNTLGKISGLELKLEGISVRDASEPGTFRKL